MGVYKNMPPVRDQLSGVIHQSIDMIDDKWAQLLCGPWIQTFAECSLDTHITCSACKLKIENKNWEDDNDRVHARRRLEQTQRNS